MSAAEFFEDDERDLGRESVLAVQRARNRAGAGFTRAAAAAAALCQVRSEHEARNEEILAAAGTLPPVFLSEARNDAVERLTHPHGCRCRICDPTEYTCLRCGATITGKLHYGSHVAHHKRVRKEKPFVLEPDGLGFVRRAVTDKEFAITLNLGALTRFQAMIVKQRPKTRTKRMTRLDKLSLAEFEQMDLHAPINLPRGTTTAGAAAALYRLAILAGVSPAAVVGVLVCYGFEHLAQELRATRKAPEVPTPRTANTAPLPQPKPALFIEREIS